MSERKRKLFCDINPTCYAISQQKEICMRHLRDLRNPRPLARTFAGQPLPNLVAEYHCNLIKRAPGVDLTLQENKAVNIRLASSRMDGLLIRPGEEFSFCRTVGRPTRRRGYRDGRVIQKGRLIPGTGGGLCNLGNTIHRMVLHSPLQVTEIHHHSDALAPDEGPRVPFSAGTSISYNNIDLRFCNPTDQLFQLRLWCDEEKLHGELRSQQPLPWTYELVEEDHHFQREGSTYYRVSKIYRVVTDRATGEQVAKELVWDNHSEVMYDYALIPPELIRA